MLHGLFVKPDGSVEYRFGVAAFLGYVWSSQLRLSNQNPAPWPFRRIDDGFTHAQTALRRLAFKLEHAASLYKSKAVEYGSGVLSWTVPVRQEELLSILLDAVVVYLRLLPDILASATPFFYADEVVPSRGFREQHKWFINKQPDFDPEYTSILYRNTGWFELLAGKNEKGLRDLLIHRFGQFQFPVTTSPDELRGEVTADLFSKSGYHVDADKTLAQATRGLLEFLDVYVRHFNERIRAAAGWAPFTTYDGSGSTIWDFPTAPESKWLFPLIDAAA